jgi:hypothetical protein
MSETDKLLSGSIPETYHRYLVPLIFEKFAQDMRNVQLRFAHDRFGNCRRQRRGHAGIST